MQATPAPGRPRGSSLRDSGPSEEDVARLADELADAEEGRQETLQTLQSEVLRLIERESEHLQSTDWLFDSPRCQLGVTSAISNQTTSENYTVNRN